ncbi:MAG TPA: MFS transporter [Kofleriaceae bacterium]|nr:MFS transporter [Kofleriaceae bacterium]
MLLCESPTITPIHRRILALAFLGWMFDFYDFILYTFLTRPISAELGLTKLDHAYALGISFTATAVGGITCGLLADRFGRRTMVSWTILVYSIGALLSGIADDKATMLVARAVAGMGVGGEWAAGHALVAETFPARDRGRAGAILQAGAPVGMAIAAVVGLLLAPEIGWRACFYASSATALLSFVARRALPESDLWLAQRTQQFGRGLRDLVAGAFASRFWFAMLLTTINGASYWLTYSWLPEYLRHRGLSLTSSGGYLAAVIGGQIVGYTVFGWFSDRLGRRYAFTLFALVMAAGLMPLTFFWTHFADTPGLIYAGTFLVGVGTGTWSNFGPMLAELFPTEVRNTGMSIIFNVSRAAQFGVPVVIALLEPTFGLGAGIGLAAAFALVAAALVWILPETKSIRLS